MLGYKYMRPLGAPTINFSLSNSHNVQQILRQGKEKYMEAISQRVLDMKHVNGVKQVKLFVIFPCAQFHLYLGFCMIFSQVSD